MPVYCHGIGADDATSYGLCQLDERGCFPTAVGPVSTMAFTTAYGAALLSVMSCWYLPVSVFCPFWVISFPVLICSYANDSSWPAMGAGAPPIVSPSFDVVVGLGNEHGMMAHNRCFTGDMTTFHRYYLSLCFPLYHPKQPQHLSNLNSFLWQWKTGCRNPHHAAFPAAKGLSKALTGKYSIYLF